MDAALNSFTKLQSFLPDRFGGFVLFLVLLGIFYRIYNGVVSEAASHRDLVKFLRLGTYSKIYQDAVISVLRKTDRWFLSEKQYSFLPATSVARAWTLRLYARTILFAAIYPIISVIVQWAITDQDTSINKTVMMKGGAHWAVRVTFIVALALSIASSFMITRSMIRTRRVIFTGIAIALAVFGVASAVIGGAKGFAITAAAGIVIALALILASRAVNIIAAPVAAATVGGATIAFIQPQLKDLATNWFYAYQFAYDVLSSAVNAIVSIALGIALILLFKRIEDKPGPVNGWLFGVVSLCAFVFLAIASGRGDPNLSWGTYYLFLGLIPLINAVFDFASIGLTRWALRNGIKKISWRTLAFSAFDLLTAALIFLALGCFCVFVLVVLNALAGGNVVQLEDVVVSGKVKKGMFSDIKQNPYNYWWLYFTFLSTLLPTIIHAMIAVWAIGPIILGQKLRNVLATMIDECSTHFLKRLVGTSLLAGWTVVAFSVPIVSIVQIGKWTRNNHPDWGTHLLSVFESFHSVLQGISFLVQ